jgi:hypothetical protein
MVGAVTDGAVVAAAGAVVVGAEVARVVEDTAGFEEVGFGEANAAVVVVIGAATVDVVGAAVVVVVGAAVAVDPPSTCTVPRMLGWMAQW